MNSLWVTFFLNEPEPTCLHIVKWFQLLLPNINSFICIQLFVCTQLNVFKAFNIGI